MNRRILYIGNNLSLKTGYPTTLETLSKYLSIEGFKLYKVSSKENKLFRLLDMCWAVIKHRNKIDYILIDTFSTSNFYFAWLTSQIARLLKLKYIPILHGGNLPQRLDKSPNLSRQLFNYSFKNIAPSNYLKTEFKKRAFRTELIPNILEIDEIEFIKRNQLKPNLLWVRSIKELYNPTMAIEVLKMVKEEFPVANLCMVGPVRDNSIEKVKKLVIEYDLEEYFEFTGGLPAEEWHKKSEQFDIFVNTTNIDNTPVSVMEAMALGLTIVSTNVGGMPYLVKNGIDGILVEQGNASEMAAAIVKLIKENNQDLSINARKKAEDFGWGVVKKSWLSILK